MSDLDHRVRHFGGWDDVPALLLAWGGVDAPGAPSAIPVTLPAVPPGLAGQTGIRLRDALAAGDAPLAAVLATGLDEAHRIELLLGAALRDARGGHAAAQLWLAADASPARGEPDPRWWPVCRLLAEPGADHTLDLLASAYVAERRAPDRWTPAGSTELPAALDDLTVADALVRGVSGLALLAALADRPLHAAVSCYYRRGTIHALGPRPLLVLAAT